MQKYNLEIDVTKITKERLVRNSFTKSDGTAVNQMNLKAVVVLNKDKVLKEGPTWVLKEVGFVAEESKKDEPTNYIGRVTVFEDKVEDVADEPIFDDLTSNNLDYPADDIDPENIPF